MLAERRKSFTTETTGSSGMLGERQFVNVSLKVKILSSNARVNSSIKQLLLTRGRQLVEGVQTLVEENTGIFVIQIT